MRKTFKLFCAAALAALAVSSCGKIWDEFDNVHGEIDGLEARIAELETKLNDQVATINTTLGNLAKADEKLAADIAALVKDVDAAEALLEKLDAADGTINGKIDDLAKALAEFETENEKALAEIVAKIAVVKVEKNKAGNVVLTFADGSTLEVAAADPNANNAGLVTVVDGKWAVVGADGKTTVLDAELHPDTKIDFKIAENTLFVSYDGGKTWEKTDVVVNDETTINIVEDFEYTEGDAFVTVTVGGKKYQLPLYEADNSSLVLTNNNFYLRYTATKTVELTAEDISEYYVMSKPDGWKANLDGTTLTVVAPAKKAIEIGAAETEGEILIHATTETGVCKVAKINVATGPGLTLSVDNKGNIVIKNSYLGKWQQYGPNGWESGYGFSNFFLGMATEEFVNDVEAFMGFVEEEWVTPDESFCVQGVYGQIFERGEYVEDKYETDVIETSVAKLLKESGKELNYGDRYVVWVAPADAEGKVIPSEVAYVDFTNFIVEVEATAVSHKDIALSLNVKGADAYAIGLVAVSEYANADNPMTFDEYMTDQYAGGAWAGFMYGYPEALNQYYTESYEMHTDETLPSTLNLSEVLGEDLAFGETYKLWVMPIFYSKMIFDEIEDAYDVSAYDYEKDFLPYVFEFKTNEIVEGSSVAIALGEAEVGYDYVNVPYTATGAENVYYSFFTSDEYNKLSDDEIIPTIIESCYWPESSEGILAKDYLNHGENLILGVLAVDPSGKYSFVEKPYKTLTVERNSATVNISEVKSEGAEYKVVLSVTGANTLAVTTQYSSEDEAEELEGIKSYETYLLNNRYFDFYEVVDGKVTFTTSCPSYCNLYVWACNVDAEEKVTDMQSAPLVFNPADKVTPSPDKKQWVTTDKTIGTMLMGAPAGNIIDLGARMYQDYSYTGMFEANSYGMGLNMVDLGGDETDADNWYTFTWGTYTVEPTDETSGVIKMVNNQGGELTIPYKNYDGKKCTFDLKELVMASEATWIDYTLGTGEGYLVIMG